MSSARHSARPRWAFSLAEATSLPLRGEDHPLRREFSRLLYGASAVATALALGIFALWYFALREDTAAPMREVVIVHYTDLGIPPSIKTPAPPQVNVAEAIIPPEIAIPEPVADDQITEVRTIATQAEMAEALQPITMEDLGLAEGDPFVVDLNIDAQPAPDEFVAVDVEPMRISIDPPVYPEMARSAEIEGTVLVRVLVGKDGKVKDAKLVEGHEMLVDAAMICARTAVFRPALMQHRPVEVWILMPVIFKLH